MSVRMVLWTMAFLTAVPALAQKKLTNDLIWYSPNFSVDYVSGFNPMKDGKHFTRLEYDQGGVAIVKYDYATNSKVATILTVPQFSDKAGKPVTIDAYTFSADETRMLIASDEEAIYRYSSQAEYFIYDRESGEVKPLSVVEGKQRLAEFSPDGKKVAFVRANNLFVMDVASGKETRITLDGKMNEIINGGTDWVYEEEFGFDKGFYWSPDSRYIAFYRFDETHVKQFQMPVYGTLYPEMHTFKYPKAGEANSDVTIQVYDLAKNKVRTADTGTEKDQYIPRIRWTKKGALCMLRMNRHQNLLEFLITKVNGEGVLTSKVLHTEKSETYVEVTDNWIFLDDNSFLWTSESSGYNHIWRIAENGTATQITKGEWDVVEIKGVDHKKGLIYYISAQESAMERTLYVVDFNGKKKKKLNKRKGHNDATFSSGMEYYVNIHSDANTPYYISLHNSKGKELQVLADNKELKKNLEEYQLSEKEFFNFTTSEGIRLNGWMIKPPHFDESQTYPVLMHVYGGPGINTVNDRYDGHNYLWHQMLAQKGYIVASVDGRGTGYRGAEFKKCTYRQLGKLETIDQMEAARYLGGLTYVDASRIGIQGWSYGGYMASLCLTKGADVFKMGIAVAPVTNWRYYDSIYTERYMRTPQENAEGYDDNSPINHVEKLKGAYLIVHGSSDDNVHYQNTMEMMDALIRKGIPFDQAIYPNRNHGIYGGKTRLHLFNHMLQFVEDHL